MFEQKKYLVQFIGVDRLKFDRNLDGTDLIQNLLKLKLSRNDEDLFGQEGTIEINDNHQFLLFKPKNSQNRTLNLPIEYLAFSCALRRMKLNSNKNYDQRNLDQIYRREFENIHLANRYPQLIVGSPIFISIFYGFDQDLCYIFLTQTSNDSCSLVMTIMKSFQFIHQIKEDSSFSNNHYQHQQQEKEKEKEKEKENQQSLNSSFPISFIDQHILVKQSTIERINDDSSAIILLENSLNPIDSFFICYSIQ